MTTSIAFFIGLGIGAVLASRRLIRLHFFLIATCAAVAISPLFTGWYAIVIGNSVTPIESIHVPVLSTLAAVLHTLGEFPLDIAGGFFSADVFFEGEGVVEVRPWVIMTTWMALAAGLLMTALSYGRNRAKPRVSVGGTSRMISEESAASSGRARSTQ
jgi:hypothetical protein